MWFFSAEAWSLFFRYGYLAFVVLCTFAGFLLAGHALITAAFRLVGKYYGWQALLEAGASHTVPSGFADSGTRDSARQLALRLRAFACLKVFQQHELAQVEYVVYEAVAVPD